MIRQPASVTFMDYYGLLCPSKLHWMMTAIFQPFAWHFDDTAGFSLDNYGVPVLALSAAFASLASMFNCLLNTAEGTYRAKIW